MTEICNKYHNVGLLFCHLLFSSFCLLICLHLQPHNNLKLLAWSSRKKIVQTKLLYKVQSLPSSILMNIYILLIIQGIDMAETGWRMIVMLPNQARYLAGCEQHGCGLLQGRPRDRHFGFSSLVFQVLKIKSKNNNNFIVGFWIWMNFHQSFKKCSILTPDMRKQPQTS